MNCITFTSMSFKPRIRSMRPIEKFLSRVLLKKEKRTKTNFLGLGDVAGNYFIGERVSRHFSPPTAVQLRNSLSYENRLFDRISKLTSLDARSSSGLSRASERANERANRECRVLLRDASKMWDTAAHGGRQGPARLSPRNSPLTPYLVARRG